MFVGPFTALFLICLVSFVSYLAQINSLAIEKEQSTNRINSEAITTLKDSYDQILSIGNSASRLKGSNAEEISQNLDDFVDTELKGEETFGISHVSFITIQQENPSIYRIFPVSEKYGDAKSLEGVELKQFFNIEDEIVTLIESGTPQVSATFRSQQLVQDKEVYALMLFPHYVNTSAIELENNTARPTGIIAFTVAFELFLDEARLNSPGFKVMRVLNQDSEVVATSKTNLNEEDLTFLRQNIEVGNRNFIFEYDNYEAKQFEANDITFRSLLLNLSIGFIVFIVFSFLKLREIRAKKLAEIAEKEIYETDARFSALIQKSTDITFVIDSKGNVVFASPSATDKLGYKNEEIINSPVLNLVNSEEDKRRVMKILVMLDKHNEIDPFEIEINTKNGQKKIFECVVNDFRDDDAIKGIVCNSRDVTDRKKAEENELKARELYESALENTPTGVALAYQDGSCFYANESLSSFLGCTQEDVNYRRLRDFIVEEDQFAFSEMWNTLSRNFNEVSNSELRFIHPDGRQRWGLISIRAVHDEDTFQYFVVQIEDTTERRNIAERLEYQAIHDPLTGLPNRLLFVDRLEVALQRSKRTGLGVTVLFLDLDRFKIVNDSLGHAAGDRLLIAASDRIKSSVRPNDTVARFGGDEFVILCEDISENRQVEEITKRLLENINRPILLEEGEVYVTASIGIATSLAGEESPETILRDADTAMYRAKDDGRNRSAIFDERTHARAVANLETGNGMFRALDQDEFRVRYQPIISLVSGRLAGFEALVYWEDPIKGHIGPNEFIALAEETGVIVPLGMKIFETACKTLHHWHQLSEEASHLKMSINLSPRQLAEPTLYAEVKKVLKKTKVNPDRIWFEITETALMVDAESTIGMLEQLRSLGVHFEVDDFGTGFSSLSYLKKFPLDAIKIDQSFIDGLGNESEDTAIVTAVISLSHALGLQVIAEGVENAFQLAELKTLGCEYAQGYLFAKPNQKEHWDEAVETNKLFNLSNDPS